MYTLGLHYAIFILCTSCPYEHVYQIKARACIFLKGKTMYGEETWVLFDKPVRILHSAI